MKQKKKYECKEIATPSLAQMNEFFNLLKEESCAIPEQYRLAIMLMAIFGFNQSELISLRVSDVSLEKMTVKLNSNFQVPIPSNLLGLFRHLIALAGCSDYLFPNHKDNSTPIAKAKISYVVRKLHPNFKLYSFRKFMAYFLADREVSREILITILNLKSLRQDFVELDYLDERCEIHAKLGAMFLPEAFTKKELKMLGVV